MTGDPDGSGRDLPGWLPSGLRAAAAWSAAALLVGAVLYLVVQFAVGVGLLVLTFFVGLLLTALLRPVVDRLDRLGLPRLAATWLVLLAATGVAVGLGLFVQQRLASQLPTLRANLAGGLDRLRDLLVEQVGLSSEQVDELIDAAIAQVRGSAGGATGEAIVTGAMTLLTVLAGLVLALFTAFWLVYDGDRIWRFVLHLFPEAWQDRTDRAGSMAWASLGGYLRGLTLVALFDAVGIGLALLVLDVPIPFTLALLTFFGAYVPFIGATVTGLAAVLVALAAEGVTTALLTLAAIILVQQLEDNLLHPVIMGHTVELHPLAIAYAVLLGGLLWGIPGAVLGVPLLATAYAVGSSLATSP